jgi:hypothetical protein
LKVELWGKIREDLKNDPLSGKGKEKEKPRDDNLTGEDEWRVLEEWKLDLGQLVPLSDDVNPRVRFSSSTLLIQISFSSAGAGRAAVQHPRGHFAPTGADVLFSLCGAAYL